MLKSPYLEQNQRPSQMKVFDNLIIGFNHLFLEISRLNLEILSKWSIDKEKDTIKSNDLRIKCK
jgi:hypothetical protein